MKEQIVDGVIYKLPNKLSDFQLRLFVHLINWKWKYITKEVGWNKDPKGNLLPYDAILPESVHDSFPLIYPSVLADLKLLKEKFDFKFHKHFNHMASSQAANANLFLPILLSANVNDILEQIIPNYCRLAIEDLYKGFRIEYWDGNSNKEKGVLKDHSAFAGTDSDIAISYINNKEELCLWLVEHKLREEEFTECGGYKSKGRNKAKHICKKSFTEILEDKSSCYYHDVCNYEYWNITEANQSFFANHSKHLMCAFKGGMNQLWRNQLLGFALEKKGKYKYVHFSVVYHPDNHALSQSIADYKELINDNPKFSVFTSSEILNAAYKIDDKELLKWINWYRELYNTK